MPRLVDRPVARPVSRLHGQVLTATQRLQGRVFFLGDELAHALGRPCGRDADKARPDPAGGDEDCRKQLALESVVARDHRVAPAVSWPSF